MNAIPYWGSECVSVQLYMIGTNRWIEDKMDEKMMENSINKRKFHLNRKYSILSLTYTLVDWVNVYMCVFNVSFSGHFDKIWCIVSVSSFFSLLLLRNLKRIYTHIARNLNNGLVPMPCLTLLVFAKCALSTFRHTHCLDEWTCETSNTIFMF